MKNPDNFDIDDWCHEFDIKKYEILEGKINVFGDVNIKENTRFEKIPIKFGSVTGKFICRSNSLRTLENCPEIVDGDFDCSNNYLTSLKCGPKFVGGYYFCHANKLKSLMGSPDIILKDFYAGRNLLEDLIGSPTEISGDFNCSLNKLKSLCGCPKIIRGDFNIYENKIQTIDDYPFVLEGKFIYGSNFISEIIEIFEEEGKIPRMLMDYKPISENKIYKSRFDQMMEELLGKVIPYEFKNYEIV